MNIGHFMLNTLKYFIKLFYNNVIIHTRLIVFNRILAI